MTKFLFTTLPTNDLGLMTRSVPIAAALTQDGHEVTFCSVGRAPMRFVADAGFANVIPVHPIYDLMADEASVRGLVRLLGSDRWRARHASRWQVLRQLVPALPVRRAPVNVPAWNVDHSGAQMGMLNPGFVRACSTAMIDVVARPDVDVVVDFWNPFAAIAARATGKPLVTVIQADAHPSSRGFIWWREPPGDLPSPVPAMNPVLEHLGVPPISTLADLSVGDLTLVVGTPITDPLPDGVDVTYIGPAVWQRPRAELPAWIDDLGRDKPLVWVYSGNPTYGRRGSEGPMDSSVVIRSTAAALGGLNMDVVLTTGHHDLPDAIGPLPANFHVTRFLDGLAMAERSDLLVHHGGYGSCQTGLVSGTPSVILPTYSERESNARRVAALGAGIVVPVHEVGGAKVVDCDRLREAVGGAVADPALRERAQRVRDHLSSYGGPHLAAELISAFAEIASTAPVDGTR